MRILNKSIYRVSSLIKSIESIDGDKFLGRILTKDRKTLTLIKGDRVVIIRQKRILYPK
jgi:hypothetical protein